MACSDAAVSIGNPASESTEASMQVIATVAIPVIPEAHRRQAGGEGRLEIIQPILLLHPSRTAAAECRCSHCRRVLHREQPATLAAARAAVSCWPNCCSSIEAGQWSVNERPGDDKRTKGKCRLRQTSRLTVVRYTSPAYERGWVHAPSSAGPIYGAPSVRPSAHRGHWLDGRRWELGTHRQVLADPTSLRLIVIRFCQLYNYATLTRCCWFGQPVMFAEW